MFKYVKKIISLTICFNLTNEYCETRNNNTLDYNKEQCSFLIKKIAKRKSLTKSLTDEYKQLKELQKLDEQILQEVQAFIYPNLKGLTTNVIIKLERNSKSFLLMIGTLMFSLSKIA